MAKPAAAQFLPQANDADLHTRSRRAVGKELNQSEREAIMAPHLPSTIPKAKPSPSPSRSPSPSPAAHPSATKKPSSPQSRRGRRKRVRPFMKIQVHILMNAILSFIFGIYIRTRIAYHALLYRVYAILYYHHRTPEYIQRDVKDLSRLPEHLSVILELDQSESLPAGLEKLLNELGEVASWCACAGIPALSVYEKTGILKRRLETTHHSITRCFTSYFNPTHLPTLSVGAPSLQSYSPPPTHSSSPNDSGSSPRSRSPSSFSASNATAAGSSSSPPHLKLLLLGEDDGRSTLVDLTKIFAEMAQQSKLSVADISSDLINAEVNAAVMNEPDLLILFTPRVVLGGYPPWHLRLTEIFHVPDNNGVEYQVFLRALHRYAKAEMRLGR